MNMEAGRRTSVRHAGQETNPTASTGPEQGRHSICDRSRKAVKHGEKDEGIVSPASLVTATLEIYLRLFVKRL